jgi:two-component system NtrC family sensor kinase
VEKVGGVGFCGTRRRGAAFRSSRSTGHETYNRRVKLTWKLSLAVGLGVLVLLAAHAAIRVERDGRRFVDDLESDHLTLGRALATSVELLGAREGEARAKALVDEVNRRQPNLVVRWIPLGSSPATPHGFRVSPSLRTAPGLSESVSTTLENGERALVTHVTLRVPRREITAIEIVEPLSGQALYEREALIRTIVTTAIVLALCVVTILGFGVIFVGRPLSALRDHARRVGRGERAIRTELLQKDEIGELAREMNAMTAALDEARERVRVEEDARAYILAQLRHADRLRAVGEIASSVAHDLGTPMAIVRARSQMIAGGEVDAARGRELATATIVEIDRMSKHIRQLLDYARREEPTRELVNVGAWASMAVELLRPIAERRGVTLTVHAIHDTEASMDAGQMRHVLINLVTNAIEASPRNAEVVVRVSKEDRYLRVEVRDRGPGISEDLVETVFEPFFTTKAAGAGTGLGLSIARGIVEEHGGTISAAIGADGTTFVVQLPLDGAPSGGTESADGSEPRDRTLREMRHET